MTLRDAQKIVSTKVTKLNGNYLFKVPSGKYSVSVDTTSGPLSDMIISGGTNPSAPIHVDNNISLQANFGYTLPVESPSISVIKTADYDTITESALVTFTITVVNNASHSVTLTSLYDTQYGSLSGEGSCSVGGSIASGAQYQCSFSKTVSGNSGDTHTNRVIALAEDDNNQLAVASDSWIIDFIAKNIAVPLFSDIGRILLFLLFVVTGAYILRRRHVNLLQ